MNKKILALMLTGIMILGNSVVAMAAQKINSTSEGSNSAQADVIGTYTGSPAPVYRVDVTWTDMTATFTTADTWNTNTLQYDQHSATGWTTNAKVKAENYSNVEVNIGLACNVNKNVVGADENDSSKASVTGTFIGARDDYSLDSAVGKTVDTVDNNTWSLSFTGMPTIVFTTGQTIATVTVTIN